jgi:hypothetical protein
MIFCGRIDQHCASVHGAAPDRRRNRRGHRNDAERTVLTGDIHLTSDGVYPGFNWPQSFRVTSHLTNVNKKAVPK